MWMCQQPSVRICQVWQITACSSGQAWAWKSHKKHLRTSRGRIAAWTAINVSMLLVPWFHPGRLRFLQVPRPLTGLSPIPRWAFRFWTAHLGCPHAPQPQSTHLLSIHFLKGIVTALPAPHRLRSQAGCVPDAVIPCCLHSWQPHKCSFVSILHRNLDSVLFSHWFLSLQN